MAASRTAPLPTGTVTFLFTDIEGSTRLLDRLGEQYEAVLSDHGVLIRAAIAAYGGTEVNTEGDAFFAVFPSAVDALHAVCDAQRALQAHPWPSEAEVRVRMGLHTGEGRLGGADYVGMDVHRAARVAGAGHGGQVLLSDPTRALVAHELPANASLRDMGDHRLKDLSAPEHLWQLETEGLARDFPALRSLDVRPNNLPLAVSSFIGRIQELDDICRLLGHRRLVTLTGPGGSGKTRLAIAAAQRLLLDYADGAFFVALEDTRDRPAVTAQIAATLGVREKPDRDLEEILTDYLSRRELLLVLDNFEQVVSAAPLVSDLLAQSPGLKIIVTSREVLRVSGEQEMGVPPLRVPDPRHLPSLASLSQYEAVALFVERAVAAQPAFVVTNENAPAVAGICSQLDGLPLAIELAAARVRLLTPGAILDRLERRLSLLTGGGRDLPDRQRTLRGAIDWSYDLLDGTERRLLGRLAVFAGGWTFEAAEAVCNPGEELGRDTLDGLASLSDKSLIRADSQDEARFTMLHVVREFAAEKLDADPDAETIRNRHARHVLGLVEEAEPQLVGSEIRRWQHRVRAEEENLRAALRWTSERGDAEVGLRLAGSLWHFWHYWGTMHEGRRWLEEMLRLPGPPANECRAKALTGLGNVVYWQGDMDRAETLYGEALAIHGQLGDESRTAGTLHDLAWTAVARGDGALAGARAQEAAERYERVGDTAGAERIATWLVTGAFLMGLEGDAARAIDAISRRIETEHRNGRAHDAAEAQGTLALVLLRAGETRRAAEAARVALQQWIEIGNVGRYAVYVKVIAALELAHGQPGRAARLASAASRFSEELGGSLPDALTRLGDPIEMARAFLEPEEHERAVMEGRSMTPAQAVAYALEDAGQAASAAS